MGSTAPSLDETGTSSRWLDREECRYEKTMRPQRRGRMWIHSRILLVNLCLNPSLGTNKNCLMEPSSCLFSAKKPAEFRSNFWYFQISLLGLNYQLMLKTERISLSIPSYFFMYSSAAFVKRSINPLFLS